MVFARTVSGNITRNTPDPDKPEPKGLQLIYCQKKPQSQNRVRKSRSELDVGSHELDPKINAKL
jgi:hypothetical protein